MATGGKWNNYELTVSGSGTGAFGFAYQFASGAGEVMAVPEPQTYALLMAGLVLVGWRVRRKALA